jgi:UDP-N-acetylglucosamine 2-epimerase
MRILSVFGTRPEAIKMAPVLRALARRGRRVESLVCVTAQHRRMLDQVLALFDIAPDIDLDLMQTNQSPGDFAATAFAAVNGALDRVRPDIVLVQGDTMTAAVAAQAAFYRRVVVGHVEAGLRTNDPANPFPEEVNRRLVDVIATYRFAPTGAAARALRAEGYPASSIHMTGNTVVDALRWVMKQRPTSRVLPDIPGPLIVVTSHRREHFGEPLRRICLALLDIVGRREEVHVVYPVHLNPNVSGPVRELLGNHSRIHLIDPLPYDAFLGLMARAALVVTDSGGIQEEAPTLGVPVVVIREKTERGEAVRAGLTRLAGTSTQNIVQAVLAGLHRRRRAPKSVFGDGRAADRIVRILLAGELLTARGRRRAG